MRVALVLALLILERAPAAQSDPLAPLPDPPPPVACSRLRSFAAIHQQ